MPTIENPIRSLSYGYWSLDCDLGEMFLNFPLPEKLQPYAGVQMESVKPFLEQMDHMPPIKGEEEWTQYLFGFTTSPFCTMKIYYHAEEGIIGDWRDKDNPLWWDEIILNLPGSSNFDPRLPFVMRWDKIRNCISGFL